MQLDARSNPWVTLWTLCIGFFMIMLDMTIVVVATPAIMSDLRSDISDVIWVTSAYLLTFAVSLLVTGRLGDRFGPKNVYISGLVLFTASSIWCGLATSVGVLIAARAVQGLGASLIAPQTMALITRVFPPDKRGTAMGVWGAVAGVASLVGPVVGGVFVDVLGWQWIFYMNVPLGLIGLVLALRFIPRLETRSHRFDIPGVLLSSTGMFLLVFGLQQGDANRWSPTTWVMVATGVIVLVGFILYQSKSKREPLVPLSLFRVRNFALASVAIGAVNAAMTAMVLPIFFYLETVREMSPTRAALTFSPMALCQVLLAPSVGRLVDKVHPRYIPMFGFMLNFIGLVWLATMLKVDQPIWQLMIPVALMGLAMCCIWAPLGATATHDLPMDLIGAGAGLYNTIRQVGAVLGSAAIGALIAARMTANGIASPATHDQARHLPSSLLHPFSSALAQSLVIPIVVLLIGLVASIMLTAHKKPAQATTDMSNSERTSVA
ncbi:DHA2 family efflux MFS transporter permease subunit [Nocardia sp. CA-128927]|uniref:DHA2 family efflux MFS transporter permease subunit n=1 Tax=Nocardia sp. CA-128927 TaxID=3239975 RepID=UPI003D95DF82